MALVELLRHPLSGRLRLDGQQRYERNETYSSDATLTTLEQFDLTLKYSLSSLLVQY